MSSPHKANELFYSLNQDSDGRSKNHPSTNQYLSNIQEEEKTGSVNQIHRQETLVQKLNLDSVASSSAYQTVANAKGSVFDTRRQFESLKESEEEAINREFNERTGQTTRLV